MKYPEARCPKCRSKEEQKITDWIPSDGYDYRMKQVRCGKYTCQTIYYIAPMIVEEEYVRA